MEYKNKNNLVYTCVYYQCDHVLYLGNKIFLTISMEKYYNIGNVFNINKRNIH